ncbi:hypothetical protein EVAR_49705_1 [Eumeta japonica]|uniref:Uncharacterized protein n=1 Tax=Eumeta variegata TaxID=151549 RepID=A0A4C1Z713_EUMVA|nr:hypothetical protein EVAR_49705_1 [Eumeta japonica]
MSKSGGDLAIKSVVFKPQGSARFDPDHERIETRVFDLRGIEESPPSGIVLDALNNMSSLIIDGRNPASIRRRFKHVSGGVPSGR